MECDLKLMDGEWICQRPGCGHRVSSPKRPITRCSLDPDNPFSPHYKPRGFGDTVAKLTSAVGLKPCGGCKKRQEWLNKHFPYRK